MGGAATTLVQIPVNHLLLARAAWPLRSGLNLRREHQLFQPVWPDWAKRVEQQVGFTSPDTVDATRPAGKWNHVYLRVSQQQCEVAVNGVSYYYFRIGDEEWKTARGPEQLRQVSRLW